MRIAHLTPAYFSPDSVVGGGERYVYYTAQALRLSGFVNQCIFTIGPHDRFFEQDGLPVRVFRNESPLPGAMDAFSTAIWRELAGFDIVHLHQILTNFGCVSLAILRSMASTVVVTDLGGGEHPLMLRSQGLRLADAVVSISAYSKSLLVGYFDGLHEVFVGPVDTDRFTIRSEIRRAPGTVLCVSRILPHKGIDRVIDALPCGLRLIIVGSVYHEDYYRLLKDMATGKDVSFVHDADDDALSALYALASVFVQASTARDIYGTRVAKPELMGLTTLEAMSSGLPVLVSDAGSLPELVTDPRFGRVFLDRAELVAALEDVRDAKWPQADAGAVAREHVVAKHGMLAIGRKLGSFYDTVVRTRGLPR